MEHNAQNAAFYPQAFHSSFDPAHLAFNRSEDPPPFLPPCYHAPSAPSAGPQGFHATDAGQGLEYGKPRDERETCNTTAVAANDSTTKINADLVQAFDGVTKRVSQLEKIVQGLEGSIEGLQCAEREKHTENNDRLERLELLIKEVLKGVQHFNECQKLDGASSQMRKLQVVDRKAVAGEETQIMLTERDKSHTHVEPTDTSEQMTQQFPGRLLPPQYSEAPSPDAPNYSAAYNMFPPQPRMNEPGKPATQHPFPSHHAHAAGPRDSGPPHHSMQVPPFPHQAQAHPMLPPLVPPTPPPPPAGFFNPSVEGNLYGHPQVHHQYVEPAAALSNSYHEFHQYYAKARQEVPHSSPQNGPSGTHVYETAAGMMRPTSGFVPPYVQSWQESAPPVSTYETTNSAGYSNHPPHGASHPVTSSGGGESHSRFVKALPLYSASSASSGIPVDAVSSGHNHINEVTDAVMAMGFPREQVRAVVQGLKDIGHPVDTNAVLDKIMNRGETPQSQRSRYGQG